MTAVRTGPDGDFVWILNTDKTVTRRKVVRGPGTPTMVAITSGLAAGEQVSDTGSAHCGQHRQAIHPGKVDIHQDQVRLTDARLRQSGLGIDSAQRPR